MHIPSDRYTNRSKTVLLGGPLVSIMELTMAYILLVMSAIT